MKIKTIRTIIAVAMMCCGCTDSFADDSGFGKITNDTFWNTDDGKALYSQGGGIFRFTDPKDGRTKFFWYGVRYRGAIDYRLDPSVTVEQIVFDAVTCYTSENLINWHYEGDVLTRSEADSHGKAGWMGRLG
ncbi:MAG: hypothetical protein ACI4TW_01370, partial [Prevotella sp.]